MPLSRAVRFCLVLLLTVACLRAAAGQGLGAGPIDLGQGLSYVRVHSMVSDEASVASALAANNALVLDLRYTVGARENGNAFFRALATHTGPAPLFILVSPSTSGAVGEILAASSVKFITLGTKDALPTPKVVVNQAADADQRAYEALESGMPLAALLSGKIDKSRYDEASLMKDFRSGNTDAEPPAPPDPTAKKDDDAKKAPVLTDRVLQRAVHLHAALQSIKAR